MSSSLLSTKLHIPQVRLKRVFRSCLVSRLQRGLEQKLILISAPAGYGKTTLLCEWLAASEQLVAWVSLDEDENNPAHFWAYVEAALQDALASVGKTLPELLSSPNQTINEVLLTDLVNHLDKLQQPLILVLDDYHNIGSQSIHDAVSFLIDHAPSCLHMVIATRADPPLSLARLRARSQLLDLRLTDLRFTTQEIREFLGTVMSLDLSDTDVSLLETSTEGWIAGLQMAGLSLQGRADASAFIRSFSGENRYVLDFLFEEVFQRQPEEVQEFLLRTSVLEQVCGSLCNSVSGREDGQAMLDALEHSNLFLISLDDSRKWYRYHHLFSDLLQNRLKQIFPDEIAHLHHKASDWYAAEKNMERAIAHAFAARDFERVASLIDFFVRHEEVLNNLLPLKSWMDKLPVDTLKLHPWLSVYRAWVDFETGQRETAEEQLQAVETSMQNTLEADDPQRQYVQGHIASLLAYSAFTHENIPQVLELGQKALDLLPADDRMRSSAAVILGAGYWAIGDVHQAEKAFRIAKEAALISSLPRAAPATCYIGVQLVKQGFLTDAMKTFKEGLQLATLPDGNETYLAGFPNVKVGDMYREKNDLALASQHLLRGLDQALRLGQIDVLTEAYICLGRYQLAIGDFSGTNESIQKADQAARQRKVDQYVLCWLDELRVKFWLATGNLEEAKRWAQSSGLSHEGSLSYQHDLHHQNLARVLVAQSIATGSKVLYDDAAALLKRLRAAAKQAGWVHEQIKLLLLEAALLQAHKKTQDAIMSLYHAIVLAEPGGYVRIFLDEGKPIHGLLKILANTFHAPSGMSGRYPAVEQKGRETERCREYTKMLLSKFDSAPGHMAAHPPTGQPRNVDHLSNTLMVEKLSTRESEILNLLALGYSDKKIAACLVITRETVHKHLKNIYGKLGVHSRTEAVARAREWGLL